MYTAAASVASSGYFLPPRTRVPTFLDDKDGRVCTQEDIKTATVTNFFLSLSRFKGTISSPISTQQMPTCVGALQTRHPGRYR
jgi:hypothetical protein